MAGCIVTGKLPGTYESVCVINDNTPMLALHIRPDHVFSYRIAYVNDSIGGNWSVSKDTLILQSTYFKKQVEPLTPIRKYTDIPGDRDVYLIRGKRLYAVMRNGLRRNCYLIRLRN